MHRRTRFSIGFEEVERHHGAAIKEEMVHKLRGDGTWIERRLKLTSSFLLFENEEHVVDSIPLHEITSCGPRSALARANSHKSLVDPNATPQNGEKNSDFSATSPGQEMEIQTEKEGFNSGRSYVVKLGSKESCKDWISEIAKMGKERKREVLKATRLSEWRAWARRTFYSLPFQIVVIVLITCNFIVNAMEAQYHPKEGTTQRYWIDSADYIFTAIFCLELAFNMFGHWFWAFVTDGWSIFDFCVIAASVCALSFDAIPGVSILRSVRAFRILRLIGRFQALKRMINAIVISLIPVLNAFLIGLLITLIYSILGVNLFGDRSENNFATFARAMFTLFLLMAFDKWPDDLPGFDDDGDLDWSVIIFLFSFVVVISWTLLQVVVAILLDNFIAATTSEKQRRAIEKQRKTRVVGHALDPLLEMLAATYDTTYDLSKRIEQIYTVLDTDNTGPLSFQKVQEGLRKLNVEPRVHMSAEDWVHLTEGFNLHDGKINLEQFEAMIRVQLSYYVQRQTADAVAMSNGGVELVAMLSALKIILTESDETKRITSELAYHSRGTVSPLMSRSTSFLHRSFKSNNGLQGSSGGNYGAGVQELQVLSQERGLSALNVSFDDAAPAAKHGKSPPASSKNGDDTREIALDLGRREETRLNATPRVDEKLVQEQSRKLEQQSRLFEQQSRKIDALDGQVQEVRNAVQQSVKATQTTRDQTLQKLQTILDRLPLSTPAQDARAPPPPARETERRAAPDPDLPTRAAAPPPPAVAAPPRRPPPTASVDGGTTAGPHIQTPVSPSAGTSRDRVTGPTQVYPPPFFGLSPGRGNGEREGPEGAWSVDREDVPPRPQPHPAFINSPVDPAINHIEFVLNERTGTWQRAELQARGASPSPEGSVTREQLGQDAWNQGSGSPGPRAPTASAQLAFQTRDPA